MSDRFPLFDRSRLRILPLSERRHELTLDCVLPLEAKPVADETLRTVADRILRARSESASVALMMGAHVIRSGVQRFLIDMMESGHISCVAMNGAGVIHDFEFALIGATTESVAHYIQDGRFGMWRETSRINDIVARGGREKMGLGEAVGRVIEEERFPHRDISVLAAGYRLGVPVTAHVGIGYDIVHELPNCDAAAYGETSYIDFLRFTHVLESLHRGVVMGFGSAVMAPEVFLKALSMVRNVAAQEGGSVTDFTTLVCDLASLGPDWREQPSKDDPLYYFRPWKTMLVRTVAGGGESFYLRLPHHESVPGLWTALQDAARRRAE